MLQTRNSLLQTRSNSAIYLLLSFTSKSETTVKRLNLQGWLNLRTDKRIQIPQALKPSSLCKDLMTAMPNCSFLMQILCDVISSGNFDINVRITVLNSSSELETALFFLQYFGVLSTSLLVWPFYSILKSLSSHYYCLILG